MGDDETGPVTDDGELAEITTLEQVWGEVVVLCTGLSDEQWARSTDLPGWTVKDQVSHLIGIENMIRGLPPDEVVLPDDLPHVKNDIGRFNEIPIEARRSTPGDEVLAEWVDVAADRLATLRSTPPEGFDEVSSTILGTMPLRDFLGQRALDSWAHEQDIRRALGTPGGMDSPAGLVTLERMTGAMGFVVGKKAGAADGTTVLFDLGDHQCTVTVEGGRGAVRDGDVAEPTTTLRTDRETFLLAVLGRIDPGQAAIEVEGDGELGRRIVENLTIMF
jgi:uncharacterized protein (TIGR03083 family)